MGFSVLWSPAGKGLTSWVSFVHRNLSQTLRIEKSRPIFTFIEKDCNGCCVCVWGGGGGTLYD